MISVGEIYDKDVNFLLGSGASYGLLPTLQLKIKDEAGKGLTLEELATRFERNRDSRLIPLFMHYYTTCIRPAQEFELETARSTATGKSVLENYRGFLETVLAMLQRRKAKERHCNLFTTNYDGCLPFIADEIIQSGNIDFVLNDGTRGFRKKILQARNFNSYLFQTGVFNNHLNNIPQINLINLHGSVYWNNENRGIVVDYEKRNKALLSSDSITKLQPFSNQLEDESKSINDLIFPSFSKKTIEKFWASYEKIPIVNPTKWKFHETVYEEHYYQMLRYLSYELEKPNAVLITFGFSFADEHILNLVKRSLSNPHLKVFICCFDDAVKNKTRDLFKGNNNVECIALTGKSLDFEKFNREVFTIKETLLTLPTEPLAPASAAATGGTGA